MNRRGIDMPTTDPALTGFSPLFQDLYAKFLDAREAYLEAQQIYRESVTETERLEKAAQALEAQSEEANDSWKAMAKARHADQRKINQEVERTESLKFEAEKFKRTAAIRRDELHGVLVVRIAKARDEASKRHSAARGRYREERIEALLGLLPSEGLPELLRELRDLTGDDFNSHLSRLISKAAVIESPLLNAISVPGPIPGEVIPRNGLEMARLEQSGGTSTAHPNAR